MRSSTAVWPPHSVCPGRCKFTCEASDVAVVRTVENNVILKRVDGTLWERRREGGEERRGGRRGGDQGIVSYSDGS